MQTSIYVMKWAPQPFNKFMKLKEVSFDFPVTSVSLTETPTNELKLYLASAKQFKIVDLQTATADTLSPPGLNEDKLGSAVNGVQVKDKFVACYQSKTLFDS